MWRQRLRSQSIHTIKTLLIWSTLHSNTHMQIAREEVAPLYTHIHIYRLKAVIQCGGPLKKVEKKIVRNEKNKRTQLALQVGLWPVLPQLLLWRPAANGGSPLSPKIYPESDIPSGLCHVKFRLLETTAEVHPDGRVEMTWKSPGNFTGLNPIFGEDHAVGQVCFLYVMWQIDLLSPLAFFIAGVVLAFAWRLWNELRKSDVACRDALRVLDCQNLVSSFYGPPV